ncbi:hypothetical protein TNCV_4618551 [Trichonephila clavipes]|nr:hypothetical protein TNCV_4618551 [Trichonephila clavipes]
MFLAKRHYIRPLRSKKRHDVRARFAGESVSRTTNLVGALRTTVSRVMLVYTNLGKTTSVLVCRTPAEAVHLDSLVPPVKYGVGFVMVWGAIFSCELVHLVILRGMITGDYYGSILADHLHLMLHNLSVGERPVFQENNDPVYKSRCFQTRLHGHDDERGVPSHLH